MTIEISGKMHSKNKFRLVGGFVYRFDLTFLRGNNLTSSRFLFLLLLVELQSNSHEDNVPMTR